MSKNREEFDKGLTPDEFITILKNKVKDLEEMTNG